MYLRTLQIKHNGMKTIYDVQFMRPNQQCNKGPLTSIVIGANGAGKSFLLAQITDLVAHCDKKNHNWRYNYYHAEIVEDDKTYHIIIDKNNPKNNKNNLPQDLKILAVSYVLNDKFLFQKRNPNSRYQYLGIRQSSNAAFTTDLERQIIEILLNLVGQNEKIQKVRKILRYINWKEHLHLEISLKQTIIRKGYFSDDELITQRLQLLKNSTKYRSLFSSIEEHRNTLKFWVNQLKQKEQISFDLLTSDIDKFNLQVFRELNALGLINYNLRVQKSNEPFSLAWAASGEKQLLFTCLNTLAHITYRSIVLIDEPEISLHPNWQMGYIQLLKDLFNEYNCHFILATHSHYLVSDAQANTSSIIKLCRDGEQILPTQPTEVDTYAWSAENILYEVFDAVTSRNRYIAEDLAEIFETLSASDSENRKIDDKKIKELEYLRKTLKDKDPLKAVIVGLLSKFE